MNMQTETSNKVNNGVNVEALLGAREALTEAPEAAQFNGSLQKPYSQWSDAGLSADGGLVGFRGGVGEGFASIRGAGDCSDVLLPHLLVDLLAMDLDVAGSVYAYTNLAALDLDDRDDDVVPDDDRFAGAAGQYQHQRLPSSIGARTE